MCMNHILKEMPEIQLYFVSFEDSELSDDSGMTKPLMTNFALNEINFFHIAMKVFTPYHAFFSKMYNSNIRSEEIIKPS